MSTEPVVYVVTSGEYSDYGIQAVFLDKAEAESYHADLQKSSPHDSPRIEEWAVGRPGPEVLKPSWGVRIDVATGRVETNDQSYSMVPPERDADECQVSRWAAIPAPWLPTLAVPAFNVRAPEVHTLYRESYVSQEHAVKLAVESRQRWLRLKAERGAAQ